ncbi:uncharacterized protein LOC116159878 [Photinus pyralis]|uniref:uncharacterized protein LOC116159878 n=1 Tax=Photinus pyralis TaxID=7054 RepID=UPI0012676FCC|nr:uncharacterized protein LOC116159878 [Photinus pyralis]
MNKRTLQILRNCGLASQNSDNVDKKQRSESTLPTSSIADNNCYCSPEMSLQPLTPIVSNEIQLIEDNDSNNYATLQNITIETNATNLEPGEFITDNDDDSYVDPDYSPSDASDIDDGIDSNMNSYPVTADFENVQLQSENPEEISENDTPHKKTENEHTRFEGSGEQNLESLTQKRKVGGRQKKVDEQKTRKRVRNAKSWKENIRKALKEQGKEYVSKKGSVKVAKEMKLPCTCRMKCYEKISEERRKKLFEDFYNLSKDAQDQYISETIKETTKQRERVRKLKEKNGNCSRRKFTRKYFLTDDNGQSNEVCQIMYRHTFDFTLKKIRIITEKKRVAKSSICPLDGRGKHSKHKKIADEQKDTIRNHINRFPAYRSHYSRERTSKKYLSSDLSIAEMYRLYCEYCRSNDKTAEKESLYRKIFNEEFNLSFHAPKNDTCAKCDQFALSLQNLENKQLTEEENEIQKKLLEDKEKHLDFAEKAYKQKALDKERSKQDKSFAVASFDLEKCLPTPYLRNGVSFYKRQLWTYNLTVYQTTTKGSVGICYLWNETVAGRGGQEISSCLRQFILSLPNEVEVLHLYSDSCSGQNRNIFMCTMVLLVMNEMKRLGRSLKEVHHKFMEPGHTHMEADTIHAVIEAAKRKTTAEIEVPHDWCNFIRNIRRSPPLQVVEMPQKEFLNFSSLLSDKLVHRKKNDDGEAIPWIKIKWLMYSHNNDYRCLYKTSLEESEEFKKIDLRRGSTRKRANEIEVAQPKPITLDPLPVAELKVSNLMDLLPYISQYNKPFYQALKKSEELDPDILPGAESD